MENSSKEVDQAWHAPGIGEVHNEDHTLMIFCYRAAEDTDENEPTEILDDALAKTVCAALNKEHHSPILLSKLRDLTLSRATVSPQAPEDELERLREIAHLIGSIFVHGHFKAETHNERELEKRLRAQGCFYDTLAEYEARVSRATPQNDASVIDGVSDGFDTQQAETSNFCRYCALRNGYHKDDCPVFLNVFNP